MDWASVFQHPESGLMVNVERADSTEKLQACMHVIIGALFSRDSDADVRRSFLASIEELFSRGGGNLVSQKAKINLLLSRIMYDREERAHLYAQQQANKQAGKAEARLKEDDPLQALKEI
ncbi:MAG: hypothetical protein ISR53_04200 [Rhodospirillales bacterium]|nr:hypothetical protein [Rhodospirillales bacterium]